MTSPALTACKPPAALTSRQPAASTPVARPTRTPPPGSSTRTSWPTVEQALRYAARSPQAIASPGAGPPVQLRYQRSSSRSTAISIADRSERCAPASQSDVAWSEGSSSRLALTLRPTPMTIASPDCSARIPASLRGASAPPASTSLGHFRLARTPAWASMAVTTATPVSSGSQPRAAGGTPPGRSSTENVSAAPGWLCQLRSSRPRPAVCSSATSTDPAAAPALAAAIRSAFVDPVLSTTLALVYSAEPASTAARTADGDRGEREGAGLLISLACQHSLPTA